MNSELSAFIKGSVLASAVWALVCFQVDKDKKDTIAMACEHSNNWLSDMYQADLKDTQNKLIDAEIKAKANCKIVSMEMSQNLLKVEDLATYEPGSGFTITNSTFFAGGDLPLTEEMKSSIAKIVKEQFGPECPTEIKFVGNGSIGLNISAGK